MWAFLSVFSLTCAVLIDIGVSHMYFTKQVSVAIVLFVHLTLISPPPFPLNCDVVNIHEHNLHMIIEFVFLFLNKA